MTLLSIVGTPLSFSIIMPNVKSYEAVLEFLVGDARRDKVIDE